MNPDFGDPVLVHRAVVASDLAMVPRLLMVLLCARAHPETGKVYLGRRRLAELAGCAPTTAWKYLRLLMAAGWLDPLPSAGPGGAAGYRVRTPPRIGG